MNKPNGHSSYTTMLFDGKLYMQGQVFTAVTWAVMMVKYWLNIEPATDLGFSRYALLKTKYDIHPKTGMFW